MSEAEQFETAAQFFDLAMGAMMLYLSLVSGYLLVAYFIGAQLRKDQVVFITSIFVVFASFCIWGSSGYFYVGEYFYRNAESYQHLLTDELVPAYVISGVVEIAGLIASLKFMYDIRSRASKLESHEPSA